MKSMPETCVRPKIAVINPALGNKLGSSQIFVMELTKHLQKYCDITILSGEKINEMCKPIKPLSLGKKKTSFLYKLFLKIINKFLKNPDTMLDNIAVYFPTFNELMKNNYDLIFPNSEWGGLFVASTVRWLKSTPILFTEHCGYREKGKIAQKNLSFKPDKYITLSQELKFWVKKYYPDQKVDYIPNGIDLDRFNPDISPAEVDLSGPIFGIACTNIKNKRIDLAIEAVSMLSNGSLLILSQDENLGTLLESCKKFLPPERYKIIKANYNEIASYYRACDVFTLPSFEEPLGLAYLEAMACNKPIVAENDKLRQELIGQAGILCDVSDISEYAKALYAASRHDFGDAPYLQAQKYSWDKTADAYIKAIMEMSNKKSGCHCSGGCGNKCH